MEACRASFVVSSERHLAVVDITQQVREATRRAGVVAGLAIVQADNSACAVFLSSLERQNADDFECLLEQLMSAEGRHAAAAGPFPVALTKSSRAQLLTILLGSTVVVAIEGNDIALVGEESVILADFDGPGRREVSLQIIGA